MCGSFSPLRCQNQSARQDDHANGLCIRSSCEAARLRLHSYEQPWKFWSYRSVKQIPQTFVSVRRPHCPRSPRIRLIYELAGIPLSGSMCILCCALLWICCCCVMCVGQVQTMMVPAAAALLLMWTQLPDIDSMHALMLQPVIAITYFAIHS